MHIYMKGIKLERHENDVVPGVWKRYNNKMVGRWSDFILLQKQDGRKKMNDYMYMYMYI